MALVIEDEDIERLAGQLAAIKRIDPGEAVKLALTNALEGMTLAERVRPIQDEVQSWGRSGLKADKAFFDDLSGQ